MGSPGKRRFLCGLGQSSSEEASLPFGRAGELAPPSGSSHCPEEVTHHHAGLPAQSSLVIDAQFGIALCASLRWAISIA